ncbi:MAG TPA: hypothetical protein VKU37_07710 [Verrucomicrobiae bacterium]|nr:hypothetical protein [Verrucomicrobiae bacterium]
MKSSDLFKDIFSLAVRLLGLFFLYLGLSAVTPLLDFSAIQTANAGDIINALLPVIFNLLVAWWLLGGRWLIRRAYPETSRISPPAPAPKPGALSTAVPAQSQRTPDMEIADKKLAALVEKPKDDQTA